MNNYTATESDIKNTISDFEIFCDYLIDNKVKLTKVRREIGKKDCFIINGILSRPQDLDGPKYLQNAYPTINLLFNIALHTGLFEVRSRGKSGLYIGPSPMYEEYKVLNPFSKYMFLFNAYWTRLDYDELYAETLTMFRHFMYTKLAFEVLKFAVPGERIYVDVENFRENYDYTNPIHRFFVGAGLVVHHLRDFGFWEYEKASIPEFQTCKKDIHVKAITPTAFGIAMINACCRRPYELYNEWADQEYIRMSWQDKDLKPIMERLGLSIPSADSTVEPFYKAFEPIFPPGTIDAKAANGKLDIYDKKEIAVFEGNKYIFKVRKLFS